MFFKKIITLIGAVCLCAQISFADSTQNTKTNVEKSSLAPEQQIPDQDVERLARAVDAIQRYYIKPVSDSTLLADAIRGMVSHLDPHSSFLDKEDLDELQTTVSGEFVGIGVELTTEKGLLKVISPIDGSPAAKAGMKPGDYIIKINNKLVQDMSLRDAINRIKGKIGTPVTLTILRKGENKPLNLVVMREKVQMHAVTSKMLAPGYAYIRVALFQGQVAPEVRAAIEKLKVQSGGKLSGLVLDLRGNPGGLLDASADVVDLFLDDTSKYKNLIVYTKGRVKTSDVSFYAHAGDIIKGVPIVVLINGGSASASEITAGALQDYQRAIIMGTRSFGKGSVQTVIPIGPHSAIKLTTALYYTPAGREIQARGIEPNVIVPEMSVNDKKTSGGLDLDEANYDDHIKNHDAAAEEKSDKKEDATLAKDDYQLYQALMMLQGMHAMR